MRKGYLACKRTFTVVPLHQHSLHTKLHSPMVATIDRYLLAWGVFLISSGVGRLINTDPVRSLIPLDLTLEGHAINQIS